VSIAQVETTPTQKETVARVRLNTSSTESTWARRKVKKDHAINSPKSQIRELIPAANSGVTRKDERTRLEL
jgi:hypothetical protein